ncbi:uncharacterized protein LOC123507783 [Portunus trituberculatus]|uniref:uncharacterized protein LOC123507783 n=1 Tax=Portunus trituberculatus TaxID=210409 RepID=UPI001E1CBDFA|nr:uncharacterized protein LOC123507783 [Portunus trituberculatus]
MSCPPRRDETATAAPQEALACVSTMAENIQQSHQTNTEQHPQEQPNNPLTLLLTVLEYEDPHSPVPDPSVYDQQGYNCFGYDKEGYDKDGYNWQGFDRQRRSRWLRRPSTARLMLRRAFLQHSRQNCCVGSEDAKTVREGASC